jgi:hypothetical protein
MRRPELHQEGKVGYQNFGVVLAWATRGKFWVHVNTSAVGQGYGRFKIPRDTQYWDSARVGLGRLCRNAAMEQQDSGQIPSSKQLGQDLFRALLTEDLAGLFVQSTVVASRTRSRLRFQIRFRGEDSALALLHRLPWELLYEKKRGFLSLDQSVSLVRQVEVKQPTAPRKLPTKPHVLIISSNPSGQSALDLLGEQESIRKAWEAQGSGTVSVLPDVRVDTLRAALVREAVHIIHYMGHADLHPDSGEVMLLLESPDQSPDRVTAETFTRLLADVDSLCFVFLNACYTARPPVATDSFSSLGLAVSLVSAGIPAVLAMQLPVSDVAAKAFSESVHGGMASGKSIEMAVTEGRKRLAAKWRDTPDWSAPVLFEGERSRQIYDDSIIAADRGMPIGGQWRTEITYPDNRQGKEKAQILPWLENKFVMNLRYSEGRWVGEAICYEGYSEGFIYELDGIFEHKIFACTYRVENKPGLERGALVLKLTENKTIVILKGWVTYWEDQLDEILSVPCTWYPSL